MRPPDGDGTIVAGLIDGRGATLLPATLRERLERRPEAERVRIGALEAYRYVGLRPRGAAEPVTAMYVSPTSRGVATVACVGVPRAGSCASVAASLTLDDGVRAYPLGPNATYGKAVDAVVDRLQRARARALGDLRRARTNRSQATAAAAVGVRVPARRHGAARRAAHAARDGAARRHAPGVRRRRLDVRGASRSARARERRPYATRRDQARRRDAAARRAVAALDGLGYRVG